VNTELFIAKRIFSSGGKNQKLSDRIVKLALWGIAIGLAVMILSVAIVTGFKQEVTNKVVGFGSHLQIVNLDSNQSYETQALNKNQPFLEEIKKLEGIRHVQSFATKWGIIKTDDEVQGIVLKGVGSDFDWDFFKQNLVEGAIFEVTDSVKSNNIWISQQTASLLKLKLGDELLMFFINESERVPRNRNFIVSGIFKTGLEEFDQMFALADIGHIQRLNNWKNDEVSGFEVTLDDINTIDEKESIIRDIVINYSAEDGPVIRVVNIMQKYPQIFDWLKLLDMNVWIILSLMVLVSGFNMVSGLLVIILERTQMIGILKSLGSPDWSIRKVFLYFSTMLISKALLWGNIIGIVICLVQKYFHIFALDPASYYMEYVPINFSVLNLFLLNIGTITITVSMLVIPSYFITRISPEKTVRFE